MGRAMQDIRDRVSAVQASLPRDARAPGRPVQPMSLTDRRLRWPMVVGLCAMYCVMSAQVNTAFFVMDRFGVPAAQATGLTGAMLTAVGLAVVPREKRVTSCCAAPLR